MIIKFINNVAHNLGMLKEGSTLKSETKEVEMVLCDLNVQGTQQRAVLVDTPGYPEDDSESRSKIQSWIATQ